MRGPDVTSRAESDRLSDDRLRASSCELNRAIHRAGLVTMSFGNASVLDVAAGVMAIKPSGVPCDEVTPEQIVVVDLQGDTARPHHLRASSDAATHLVLYHDLPDIGAVIHTHSPHATSWAQARRSIPCFGTTHADHFGGEVPVTQPLDPDEIDDNYTGNTGQAIADLFGPGKIDSGRVPAALVAGHGPFVWGRDSLSALANAIALEAVAHMAIMTLQIDPSSEPLDSGLLERHFTRKHGPGASYGQARGFSR
jgi:L-ribulose-5-phosphate 4-epimerase